MFHNYVSLLYKELIKYCMSTYCVNCSSFLSLSFHLVCHAEYNAFVNRGDKDLTGSTLYTGLFPCKDCAKLIVQIGVSTVIYMSHKHRDKPKYKIAEDIFIKAKVKTR